MKFQFIQKNIKRILGIILLSGIFPEKILGALENPLGEGKTDPRIIIGLAIKGAMSILGSLALATFIYGGFVWMLSAGNPEKVTKGRNILVWAFIGLVVIFSSYAIINFILGDNFLSPFLVI